MPPRIAAIALLLPLTLAAAGPAPRPAVLRAIFPGQKVALLPGATLNASFVDPTLPFSWPDTFAGEPVYLVSGAPQFQAELCAAEDLLTEKFSSHREVRIRTVPWPGQPATALLALVQYKFRDASPASSCSSIASSCASRWRPARGAAARRISWKPATTPPSCDSNWPPSTAPPAPR